MAKDETVGRDSVVGIDYTLTDEQGKEIDASKSGEPLEYLHGHGQLVPGVENVLEGKQEGDAVQVSVAPEEGYGEKDPSKRFDVPRAQFGFEVAPGDVVQAQLPSGHLVPLQVVEVAEDKVTVDGNHPLAGKVLNFDIKVVSVRHATDEELSHGHAHGEGAHDH